MSVLRKNRRKSARSPSLGDGLRAPLAPVRQRGESPFLRNVLILLEDLDDYARFYLQRGLRLRRFGHLSGCCGNVQQSTGRRSLTKRAQFRRQRGSWESWMALDRRKNSSGHTLAARSTRPAESRKRVANLYEASELWRRWVPFFALPEVSRSGVRACQKTRPAPAECTTD